MNYFFLKMESELKLEQWFQERRPGVYAIKKYFDRDGSDYVVVDRLEPSGETHVFMIKAKRDEWTKIAVDESFLYFCFYCNVRILESTFQKLLEPLVPIFSLDIYLTKIRNFNAHCTLFGKNVIKVCFQNSVLPSNIVDIIYTYYTLES